MNLEIDKSKALCLTGHRPKGLPWGYNENDERCVSFKEKCKEIFIKAIEFGITYFLTGMAQGFDIIATEILIDLRKKYKHIKIIAVLPCENQDSKWSGTYKTRYRKILNKCDDITLIRNEYTPNCMNERNMYMVNCSTYCIACFNGKPSGTRNTILFAKQNGVKVKIIKP